MVGSLCLRGLLAALPLLAIGIVLVAVAPGIADTIEWTDPNSGNFNDPNNWTVTAGGGAPPPGIGDIVNFNDPNTYTVTFTQNEASDLLNVTAGDVTFVSDSATLRTYSISSGAADANINGGNLTIGQSGNPVRVGLGDPFGSALKIGNGADGSVNVVGIGSALSTGVFLAQKIGDGGASGSLAITEGASATIQSNPGLQVGVSTDDNTIGSILVGSGGTLNVTNFLIATSTSNATGSVTVTGSTSTINQTVHPLTIGSATGGTGTLHIMNGGTFKGTTVATTINATGTINIQDGTFNANGPLTMGAGSTLTLNGGSLNATAGLDNSAVGTLNFLDGTLTINGGTFAPNAGEPTDDYMFGGPTVAEMPHLVFGTGGTANIGRNLTVADFNHGELTIQNGGTVSNSNSRIARFGGSTGTATVDGAGSTWMNSQSMTVGSFGNGTLNILNGGEVINGGMGFAGSGIIGAAAGSTSTATVDGAGSTWTISSTQTVGQLGNGTLNITNGGAVSNDDGRIGSNPGSTGTATVDGAGSTWTNSGDLTVGGSFTFAGGTGTLNVQNSGLVEVDGTLKIWNSGTVTLDDGSIVAATFDNTDGGTFNFIDGTLTVDTFQGDLTQDGGTLAPGASPGTTNITGNYALNAGTLETEFGGAGNPIDLVDVTGNINIALVGTSLDLRPLGAMAAGTYSLMQTTGGALTGTFENVTDLGVYDNLFGVQYTATSVTLTLDQDLIAGDFDLDGDVDGADFLKWQRGGSPVPLSQSDLNDWETNYGTVAPLSATSAAVPEPGAALLLLMAAGIAPLACLRRVGRA